MGILVDGVWQADGTIPTGSGGQFQRFETQFRNWITTDGSAGPTGAGGFKAEAGRYHLYISHACPWAHRTVIMRALKGLEDMISVSVVHWFMGKNGWTFEPGEGVVADSVNGAEFLYQVYLAAAPDYSGRVSVPVLWDKVGATIVNNESAEIIRMFSSAFDAVGAKDGDYYPADMRGAIDAVNERVYSALNNGVYRSGFASTQAAYEEAVVPLFATLDWLEDILGRQKFVASDRFSETDIRLFTTLIRFDAVYHGHFKCNIRRLIDYPNLWAYTRQIYQMDEVRGTVDFGHIKQHYYASHETVNPSRIVPVGPDIDYDAPHGRG